jgi:REP element-mobilizing transposase RayT
MAHVFHQLYFHVTWATHSRAPLIHRSWRPQFLEIINEEVKNRGGWLIRHNAMPDHTHLLVRLPPTVRISDFLGEVKGVTAYRVNHDLHPKFKLRWQEGYGILSLRKAELAKVSRYIDNQEEHHRKGTLSALLETTEILENDWPEDAGSPLKGAKKNRLLSRTQA